MSLYNAPWAPPMSRLVIKWTRRTSSIISHTERQQCRLYRGCQFLKLIGLYYPFTAGPAKALLFGGCPRQDAKDRFLECVWILRGNNFAQTGQYLPAIAHIGSDAGYTAGHGFAQHVREALTLGCQHQQ